MKAFLLAAGYGTRLKPLTDTTPKCLIPICGKPLLQWWMDLFWQHGITDVLINTHYLRDQVADFISENNRVGKVKLHEAFERQLLGSGGTIREQKNFVKDEESFLICYADNLTNMNLSALMDFHQKNNGILSMALFHTNVPKQCGIVELDSENRIIDFVEKPEIPKSNLANAGVYAVGKEIFSCLPARKVLDFGKDVLSQLTGKMYGWHMQNYLIDVGTIENYQKAQKEWNELQMHRKDIK